MSGVCHLLGQNLRQSLRFLETQFPDLEGLWPTIGAQLRLVEGMHEVRVRAPVWLWEWFRLRGSSPGMLLFVAVVSVSQRNVQSAIFSSTLRKSQ